MTQSKRSLTLSWRRPLSYRNLWTGFYMITTSVMKELKVRYCKLENFSICLCSYKNNILKIPYSESYVLSSYSPVKLVIFLKSRLLFNVFYCFCMFLNKHFTNLKYAYLKKWKLLCVIMWYYFYMKTNVLLDFHICISVTLNL